MTRELDDAEPVFPIGIATKLTGLTERQIRYYDRLGLVSPARTSGGRRMYSKADIRALLEVKRLMAGGWTLREIAQRFSLSARTAQEAEPEPVGDRDVHFKKGEVFASRFPIQAGRGMPGGVIAGRRPAFPARETRPTPFASGHTGEPEPVRSLYPITRRDELLRAIDEVKASRLNRGDAGGKSER